MSKMKEISDLGNITYYEVITLCCRPTHYFRTRDMAFVKLVAVTRA